MKALIAIVAVFLVPALQAQTSQIDPHKVLPIVERLAEIEVSNQILPLLMTREQIRQILPVIERCRKNNRDQEKKEADRLKALTAEIDKVYDEAVRGIVPSKEFLDRITNLFLTFENERRGVLLANGIILTESLNTVLNEGQKRAAIGVVDAVFDPESGVMTDASPDAKLRYFALSVLLNDRAYDFLTKLNPSMD